MKSCLQTGSGFKFGRSNHLKACTDTQCIFLSFAFICASLKTQYLFFGCFRCAPILKVLLHVLQACLAASRSQLHQHIQENPLNSAGAANTINNGTYLTSEHERDDLKHALIAAQESVAVQILLEACQETYKDRVRFYPTFFFSFLWFLLQQL